MTVVARWWSPQAEENVMPRVGGTGSISTFNDVELQDDDHRRVPFGFAPPSPAASPEHWGEAAWTARDILL